MSIKTAKQKGKELENYIADQIIAKGLDDRSIRDGGSGAGNREKRDINTSAQILGRTIGIEAKNHKTPHIKEWWKQTCELEQLGYEPVLVYKLGGEGLGDAKAVIYLDTLLELLKHQTNADLSTGVSDNDKWLIKKGVEVLKQIIKLLEKYL